LGRISLIWASRFIYAKPRAAASPHTRHEKFLSSLVLASAVSGTAVADEPTTGFVRKADPVTLDKSGSRLEFPKAKDGRLSFAFTWAAGNSRETIFMSKEGFFKKDGWFVYIESPTRIRMFDGAGQLELVTHSGEASGRYSVTAKGVLETCPQKAWDALPESVRKSLRDKRAI
jgi:hypothetical protein